MAGLWLYAISGRSERTFDLEGGSSIPVTIGSYRDLVEDGRIDQDPRWQISQYAKDASAGDELLIYSGDQDIGIVGIAKILEVKYLKRDSYLLIKHNLEKSRLLLGNPIPAAIIRSWKLSLRKNLVSLAPVENEVRKLLAERIGDDGVIDVEENDLTDSEIDHALQENRLRIGYVPTDSEMALARRRHGQDRIRELTLENYEKRCAVCDISERSFLIASHIVGWARAPEHRGDLTNVICLCRIHDALFEAGFWSLGDTLDILKKKSVRSDTIRLLLSNMTSFRKPLGFPPAPRFVKRHREEAAFEKPSECSVISQLQATTAFIALGANLGDRAGTIHRAVARLSETDGIKLLRLSRLIETAAVGGPADSPAYLNAAAEIETTLSPRALLGRLLAIEAELGRVRREKWEPRVIDLDLLLYGDAILDEPGLTVPHPRLHERRFVLLPLAQIAPNLVHPKLGKTIQALLDELPAEP